MSITISTTGFGESEFGSLPFGAGLGTGSSGFEFTSQIVEVPKPEGFEFEGQIVDKPKAEAVEFLGKILEAVSPEAIEYNAQILEQTHPEAVEFLVNIAATGNAEGFEYFATNLGFRCPGFGEFDFGTLPFGASACFAAAAFEYTSLVPDNPNPEGVEFESQIVDFINAEGVELTKQIADVFDPNALQYEGLIQDFADARGIEFNAQILDFLATFGIETEFQIADTPKPEGIEFNSAIVKAEGVEYRVSLYNATQLRILCEFPSRGLQAGSGNNAWGNPIATGANWQASSQNPADDFSINNINTDTVEQVYRSQTGTVSGITLDCDTETNAGVLLDTFAILNHNLTNGADLTLVASNVSNFSVIEKTINLTARPDNIYHIEPTLPLQAYRYWRLQIDDLLNQDDYIEIGTILFGASVIFTTDECMTDSVRKKPTHFFDQIKTEGFTSNKNNRSVKNRISLRFESLRYDLGNWQRLEDVFRVARTSLKCLWIPTPSVTQPSLTERFATFGKITELPEQEHNVKGTSTSDLDFITVEFDIDEAE